MTTVLVGGLASALTGARLSLHVIAAAAWGLAIWGAVTGISSVVALVMGVFLAG